MGRLSYSGGCISHGGRTSDEVSWCIQKARLVFGNFRHLWRGCDIRSSIKGGMHAVEMIRVLLYSSVESRIYAKDFGI